MLRGLSKQNEQDPQKLLRDTRTLGQRIADFFKNPVNTSICLAGIAFGCVIFPGVADLAFLVGLGIFTYAYTRKVSLPFRMPLSSRAVDYNDLSPGNNKPQKARGITFFGNDKLTNEELWFHNDDMRTHVLIFGSTGSGKTEFLLSLTYNSLVQGSGFIYVDGKGDNSLFSKVFSMARKMGREDDLLLINFMTGAKDIIGPQEKKLSNTMNPFATGSSSMLAQLVVSLMDSGSESSDGDMWKGRAISFVEALMKILVFMRDEGHILLDANSIRRYFELPRLESMVIDKQFLRDDDSPVSLEEVPQVVLEPIRNYLATLPGFNFEKKGQQAQQTLEQHGFIVMQLTRVFTSLADTYGHIIRTNLAEVDFHDVVLNRRILVTLLPALEKSPDELANLGKVIIATLKAMMASGLGEQVEGTYREMIERKPTNSPTPFVCVLDEYGYYAVPGFAVVPAQARSLGFSTIFAGQDLPAFQKASKEEAASIGANTNIKICMKLEDPAETWDFFSKTAGEAYVTKVDSFQTRSQSVLNSYLDSRTASTEKRARVDLLDLKEQGVGEAHIFFKSQIVRARTFFANPPPVEKMRLNQFIKVEKPQSYILAELENRLEAFQKSIDEKIYLQDASAYDSEELEVISDALHEHAFMEPIEKGFSTLLAYHHYLEPPEEEAVEEETAETELNIFTKLRLKDRLKELINVRDMENFQQPVLDKNYTRDKLETIERLSGKNDRQAGSISKEVVDDMQTATHYPPEIYEYPELEEINKKITALNEKIRQARE
jgi:intracellular multiplication protein IcmO